jgi:hypothetical protein
MSWKLVEFLHGAPALGVPQQIPASVERLTPISFVKRFKFWEEDIAWGETKIRNDSDVGNGRVEEAEMSTWGHSAALYPHRGFV